MMNFKGEEHFLNKNNWFAVVGASQEKTKWGYKILRRLVDRGYKAVGINPKYDHIDEIVCVSRLSELEPLPDVVVTVVPPDVTRKVFRECIKLGIGRIWMQPGSESNVAVREAENKGIEVVHRACIVVDGLVESWEEKSLPKGKNVNLLGQGFKSKLL